MIRTLKPWHSNLAKRVVKSTKLYLRDSGLFHSLQNINIYEDLITNPKIGASWEGFALEQTIPYHELRESGLYFYGVHGGVELDLLWHSQGYSFGIEFIKYSDAPKKSKSMINTINDLSLEHLWIVYPGNKRYSINSKITVLPLENC